MSLARLYERRGGIRRFTQPAFKPVAVIAPGSSNPKNFKRLSRTEMDDRRAKGLCFNCDEIYVRGHQCKRLFWLDGVEESVQGEKEDHEFEEEFPPEISLHAIMGENSGGKTMKIHGIIGEHHLLILIDSGITHNFLGTQWVTTLGLNCESKRGLQVMVANGNKVRSPGQCLNVPVTMGNQLINIDFFVLHLTGIDAVLGVNWLQTLGPILWDFRAKSMVFKQNGRVMELQGTNETHSITPVMLHVVELEATCDTDLQDTSRLIQSIIAALHEGSHEGYQKTPPCGQGFLLEGNEGCHLDLRNRLLRAQNSMKAQYDAKHRPVHFQILVHWDGLSPADSSWEDESSFPSQFPSFTLADKCPFDGGSDVVNQDHVDKELDNVDKELVKGMKVYQRRGRAGHSIAGVVEGRNLFLAFTEIMIGLEKQIHPLPPLL
ncbi:hypothetical protein SADUNF_Sadunf08G0159200 [Salix dunnii]|uniref:Chromo domain-containing protein n=1 Tax=Salix dunnii TaxID=1413687 RepID=A0A835MYB9_9ROSI|nr:hypothetical protein SADUNF_Sadunf08G0159200 [Salix dunnii]